MSGVGSTEPPGSGAAGFAGAGAGASAEIFDLGYQGYDGERTGRWMRRRAIWRDGVRISLGLGRGASGKIAPWLLIALALAPMIVLVVIAAFVGSAASDPDDFELPSYAEYYEFAIAPLSLFAAVVAPLLLCPDRRDGVLSLYAARPITALDYLGARWAAFFTVSFVVVCAPEAVLFVWNLLDARDTDAFLRADWDLVPRLLAAGAAFAVGLTTLALLVASFTTRRAYAAIGTLAVLFVGSAISGIAEENFEGTLSDALTLVAVPRVIVDTVHWIFDDELPDAPVPGYVSALWLVCLSLVLAAWLLRRTERVVRG
jgi:ABC-2 type transport system permease protein